MEILSRRQRRYQNRQNKRKAAALKRAESVGTLEDIFTFDALYNSGRKCSNNIRWKRSTQTFELELIVNTALMLEQVLNETYTPGDYKKFTIVERGKVRPISAPYLIDHQVQKIITQKILLPLYSPSIIKNNGASMKDKGFEFSKKMLRYDLTQHFKRYGKQGWIILIDFKKFFPNASHKTLLERHNRLILDDRLRRLADIVVTTNNGDRGMPLGIEPSQIEMVSLPSAVDNYIKCQLAIKGAGHYMDDYYILVPPDKDPHEIMELIIAKAESMDIAVNRLKSKVIPLTKHFKFCQATYKILESGRIIHSGNRKSAYRAHRKIKAFKDKLSKGKMSYEDLWTSVNGVLSYYENYNSHKRVLKLRRYFYSMFGFSPETIDTFREIQRKKDMRYIVTKRFKGKGLCGNVNIPAMSVCECDRNIIFWNDKPICLVTSENAHMHFSRDDDHGAERGKLVHAILKILSKQAPLNEDNSLYNNRWDAIWADPICQAYKRPEHNDHWLWNHEWFNAPIGDLQHIYDLIKPQPKKKEKATENV